MRKMGVLRYNMYSYEPSTCAMTDVAVTYGKKSSTESALSGAKMDFCLGAESELSIHTTHKFESVDALLLSVINFTHQGTG